ncbi:hypothetical protein CVT24_005848 [Panaeolus cyanescens]|uniref:Uncharacterized protein n=1 Tax=Panaeolus cyanescens TaxID=181874 RepID=A0A409YF39_9AGAR|nr:hypothetical protein CVT24_005848 [Panaeolus cyanescens]
MNPEYTWKKIINLTEQELIDLGFLGPDANEEVISEVKEVRAHPQRYAHVTCFEIDNKRKLLAELASSSEIDQKRLRLQLPTNPEDYTIVAPNLLSRFEMHFWYYNGISPGPPLLWRSDFDTNPFPTPAPGDDHSFTIPKKSVRPVFGTRLSEVWDTVVTQILALVKSRGIKIRFMLPVRFLTVVDDNDDKGTYGPVVVWIGVPPDTSTPAALRDATPDILLILKDAQVTDAVVEWYEECGVAERL